jgi:dihydroorotate dehydrogenase (fumarate)
MDTRTSSVDGNEAADVAKVLLVGADVAMMTAAVRRDGPGRLTAAEAVRRGWMDGHDHRSVDQLRGRASHAHIEDPAAFGRADYLHTLHSWTTCSPSA